MQAVAQDMARDLHIGRIVDGYAGGCRIAEQVRVDAGAESHLGARRDGVIDAVIGQRARPIRDP